MYQYNLIYNGSLLHYMLKLEQFLHQLNICVPVGIYSKYRFRPILLPNKDCYLVEGKKEEYFSYNDLIQVVPNLVELPSERSILILDENSEYVCRTRDLTLTPYLPIRAQTLLEDIFKYIYTNTRKWEFKHAHLVIDDAIEYAICKHINEYISPEQLDYICSQISIIMDGVIEEIYGCIRKLGWHELYIEIVDDVLRVFDMGDYRIRHYMEIHRRHDY